MSTEHIDFEKSCLIFFSSVLFLKKGDRLLLYIDRGSDEPTTNAIRKYARQYGLEADILKLHEFTEISDIVKTLVTKIQTGHYNARCELSD